MHTRTIRSLATGILAALFLTLPAAAQSPDVAAAGSSDSLSAVVIVTDSLPLAANAPPAVPATPSLSPTVDGARVAVRAPAPAPAVAVMRARGGLQQSQVLMIVGGSAVLLGILVDNGASDVLIIGGAGVGLWGLYQYLKTNQ